jgi:hypothetical protein
MATNRRLWDEALVLELIRENDAAVDQALWELYCRHKENRDVFDEKDSRFLCDVASRMAQYKYKLTPRQRVAVRKLLPKYWQHIAAIKNAKMDDSAPSATEEAKGATDAATIALKTKTAVANPLWGLF